MSALGNGERGQIVIYILALACFIYIYPPVCIESVDGKDIKIQTSAWIFTSIAASARHIYGDLENALHDPKSKQN